MSMKGIKENLEITSVISLSILLILWDLLIINPGSNSHITRRFFSPAVSKHHVNISVTLFQATL